VLLLDGQVQLYREHGEQWGTVGAVQMDLQGVANQRFSFVFLKH
jgi:hypothetical protein